MPESIKTELLDRVLTLEIARPEKRNALTLSMYQALTTALEQATTDSAVRVVLIRGCDGSFCSGNDIGDFLAAGQDAAAVTPALQFLQTLANFNKPLVAAVDGPAVGIGTTLLLHCDLVYASRSARFQLPFVNLGLVPEGGSSLLLPQMLGHQRAAELLLLGEPFCADKALELGILNQVVEDDDLLFHARQRALALAAKPPSALSAAKLLMKQSRGSSLQDVLVQEVNEFAHRLRSPEAQEALTAFQQRRPADFSRFE